MKKSILVLMMSVGIAMVGSAGNLSVTETTMTYTMGVGVTAGTEFLIRYDFGSNVLTSGVAGGGLSITSSSTDHQITVRSGGTVNDSFVQFRIIVGTSDLSADDQLVLDSSQFGLDADSYTVTATLEDDFGQFDTSGTHTATYTAPATPPSLNPTIRRVPTLTEWGFILTALIILSLGVFTIRNKYTRI